MKVAITCMFLVYCTVVGVVGARKCHQGADAEAAKDSIDCTDRNATMCSGPVFTEYTGLSAVTYACGECDAGATITVQVPCTAARTCSTTCNITAGTCKECDEDHCNKPDPAIADAVTFNCTHFKHNAEEEKFVAEATVTTCHALKATGMTCNSNGAEADKTYVVQNLGCGPCVEADKTAEKCVQCDGDNCNSAATITAFLLPMIALFYNVF